MKHAKMESAAFSFTLSLPCVREHSAILVRTPQDVYKVLRETADLAQEAFSILTLNKKNWMIDRHLITLGIIDASLIHQREVFRAAIIDNASALILSHTHPSGDPAPSAEDLAITRQMVASGRIIGIRVLDHVILGRPNNGSTGFFSLRESGLIDFET